MGFWCDKTIQSVKPVHGTQAGCPDAEYEPGTIGTPIQNIAITIAGRGLQQLGYRGKDSQRQPDAQGPARK